VIIHAYNDHVRLLPPEPLVVRQPQSTRVEGADILMKSCPVCALIGTCQLNVGLAPRAYQAYEKKGGALIDEQRGQLWDVGAR
jgi:hypothetical protein